MNQTPLEKRLAWQCRRGMLELDVILIPFLEQHFSSLDKAEQLLFEQLLKHPDPDLYTWLMGYGECSHADLEPIITLVRKKMLLKS